MGLFDFFRKKVKPAENIQSSNDSITKLCFVICSNAEPEELSHSQEVVEKIFGRGYTAKVEGGFVTIEKGKNNIGILAHMPMPIPGGEAEENAGGNFLWPNGKEEAAKHRSHVLVTNISAGEQSPVQSAITVTKLALVALQLFDGIGVYWGNASVTNSREVFEGFCEDISEDRIPLPIWLRFQPVRVSDDEIGLYTLGMMQFGLMDIEIDRCSMSIQEAFEFVGNIAQYLIDNGDVIADGNTVGGTAEERIVVRHKPSMIDRKKRVYKLMFNN